MLGKMQRDMVGVWSAFVYLYIRVFVEGVELWGLAHMSIEGSKPTSRLLAFFLILLLLAERFSCNRLTSQTLVVSISPCGVHVHTFFVPLL